MFGVINCGNTVNNPLLISPCCYFLRYTLSIFSFQNHVKISFNARCDRN